MVRGRRRLDTRRTFDRIRGPEVDENDDRRLAYNTYMDWCSYEYVQV